MENGKMKKVLFISYMFPPIAGGGIQRPLKFVKYLPDYGIRPVVFCPEKALWRANIHEKEDYPFLIWQLPTIYTFYWLMAAPAIQYLCQSN